MFAAALAPPATDWGADFALRPLDFAALPRDLAAFPLDVELLPLGLAAPRLGLARPDAPLDLLLAVADAPLPLPLDDRRFAEPAVLPLVADLELGEPDDPFEDDPLRDEARAVDPRSVVAAISHSPPCRNAPTAPACG